MGSFFVVSWWIILLFISLFIAVVAVFPQKKLVVFVVPLGVFVFGIISVQSALEHYREGVLQPKEVSGTFRVVSVPEEKSFYKQVILRGEACLNERCPAEKILWQAPIAMEVGIGARVAFVCQLEIPKNFDPEFDYRMFLAKDTIGYSCPKALQAELLPEDTLARVIRYLFFPRRAFETALNKSLPQPEAGLAMGLIIGGNNRLPDTLQQAFVTAGLSHIVAISGYNIALIAQGLVFFGIAIGLWRRQALWSAIIGIILFIVLVGAPASAVRAGVMGCSLFMALFFGRLSRGINMLLLAGAVMLFFQPLLLRYDVGFQLSFLATLAITLSAPYIEHWLPKEFFGKSVVEIALMTFSVELFVLPLIAYQFHLFSPFALLMNMLLLPLVPYAMATAFVAGICFFLLPGLHILPATLAYGFLRIITLAVERLSMVRGAQIDVSLSPTALFFWYTCLFFVILGIRKYYSRKYDQTKSLS